MDATAPSPSRLRHVCDLIAVLLLFALPWAVRAGAWALELEVLLAIPLAAISLALGLAHQQRRSMS